ncbi:MAG: hypothetical protein MI866_07185, partial [Bacteroidales bacterium]|nr:hypothetical protein [Bacteroidales bacterium]
MKYYLAIVLLIGLYIHNTNAVNRYSVQYINTNNGLSQNEVTSIIQDKYGFMWFGTRGGLNRYDAYSFKHFKPGSDKQNSINNPSIERLHQDGHGNIWIGTKSGGFSIYNIDEERFITPDINHELSNRIIAFNAMTDSTMWIGGWNGGLKNYCFTNDTVQHWLGNARVNAIVHTPDGTVWCGTNNGLRYAETEDSFKSIDLQNDNNEVTEIVVDNQGEPYLWLVGWDLSLIQLNYQTHTIKQFKLPWNKTMLSPKSYSLMQDKNGNLWLGTWGDGIYKFDPKQEEFEQIDIKPGGNEGASTDYDVILDMYEDKEGDIWIGTDGGGVIRLSDKSQFSTLGSEITGGLLNLHVNAVLKDSHQNLWIGTKGQGLFVHNENAGLVSVGFQKNDRLYNKDGLVVKRIFKDAGENIWVSFNEGLYIITQGSKGSIELIHAALFFKSPHLRELRKVHQILRKNDDLWVATQQNGLYHYKYSDSSFRLVKNHVANRKEGYLPINRVTSVFVDKEE